MMGCKNFVQDINIVGSKREEVRAMGDVFINGRRQRRSPKLDRGPKNITEKRPPPPSQTPRTRCIVGIVAYCFDTLCESLQAFWV
mmetsp:Transcript_122718/g.212815  ORF Transcript_122718/g.212815 Transcript_122718/m.212815 type:complete len:85 (-) Transcript_122718:119-373(-)